MSDTLITQELINLAGGLEGGDAIRSFAVGKTRSEFLRQMIARIEVAVAEAQLVGNLVIEYTINGESVKRDLDDALNALDYMKRSASTAAGGLVRQNGEFPSNSPNTFGGMW